MKIGFIGLGIMGSRMAANLLKAGHTLTVHNRNQDKAEALVNEGAAWGESPAATAEGAEVLITMLAHPDAVRAMACGEGGFLGALADGAIWMDCSTVNPSFSREMAAAAGAHGVRFLDAPVAGSKDAAGSGALRFIVGGETADVEAVKPLAEAMGQGITHVGEAGMGAALKVVVNMQLAISMAAFAEGMALGQALGIPRDRLLDVLVGGPVTAPFLAGKRARMESGDFNNADFPLQWMQKDLHLATTSAYETGTPSPLAALSRELYTLAMQSGLSEDDFSAIYMWFNRE